DCARVLCAAPGLFLAHLRSGCNFALDDSRDMDWFLRCPHTRSDESSRPNESSALGTVSLDWTRIFSQRTLLLEVFMDECGLCVCGSAGRVFVFLRNVWSWFYGGDLRGRRTCWSQKDSTVHIA